MLTPVDDLVDRRCGADGLKGHVEVVECGEEGTNHGGKPFAASAALVLDGTSLEVSKVREGPHSSVFGGSSFHGAVANRTSITSGGVASMTSSASPRSTSKASCSIGIDGVGAVVFVVVGRGFWFGRHVGRSEDDSWERSAGLRRNQEKEPLILFQRLGSASLNSRSSVSAYFERRSRWVSLSSTGNDQLQHHDEFASFAASESRAAMPGNPVDLAMLGSRRKLEADGAAFEQRYLDGRTQRCLSEGDRSDGHEIVLVPLEIVVLLDRDDDMEVPTRAASVGLVFGARGLTFSLDANHLSVTRSPSGPSPRDSA